MSVRDILECLNMTRQPIYVDRYDGLRVRSDEGLDFAFVDGEVRWIDIAENGSKPTLHNCHSR